MTKTQTLWSVQFRYEEGFEIDLGPPTTAILVDEAEPTHWESGADFSPVSKSVSSFEMESDGETVVSGEAHVELAVIQLSPVLREVFRRGQDRFGDHILQESGGDEDGASFFEHVRDGHLFFLMVQQLAGCT